MFKVVVAGSRTFTDYHLLKEKLDYYLKNQTDIEIVSGTAQGADSLGERYAKEKGLSLRQFPADWKAHGKAAGYKRNKQMAEYCDAVIVFWDGESKGTEHMINLAREFSRKLRIVRFKSHKKPPTIQGTCRRSVGKY